MTNQHKATPDDWAQQEDWAKRSVFSDSSCLFELRARVEALEVGQQPPQDKLDRLIALDRDDPAGSLVERIATDADLCQVYNEKTTLRAVYDLGREHGAAPTQPGPAGSAPDTDARQLTLVERVTDGLPCRDADQARAALRVVADAALQMHPDKNLTWERVALWLEQEANR
jgi:hypothetical protein